MDLELVSNQKHVWNMDWSIIAISATVIATIIPLFIFLVRTLASKCFTSKPTVAPDDQSTTVACLGRSFKVGKLYNSYNDSFLTKKMLWKDDTLQKATTSNQEEEVTVDFEVISNDTLATKVHQLGIETDLSLSVVSESIEVSKSAEYLHDVKTSSRQARVVLKCQRFTKSDKLMMKKPAKFNVDSSILRDGTATHVVVGVKYGSEAFFVFDQEVPEDEDYDRVCREMESLVRKIPNMAKERESPSKEDDCVAGKLHYKVHSDKQITQTLSSINDVISIYKRFVTDTRTEVPKVAWLYPLHLLDKEAPTVHPIEHPIIMKTLNVIDSFHTLIEATTSLSKHGVCKYFPGIRQQLEQCKTSLEEQQDTFKRELSSLLPEIRKTQSDELNHLDAGYRNDIILKTTWLNEKKGEVEFLSHCIQKLCNTHGIRFAQHKQGSRCTVNLEFQFNQKNVFTPKEDRWYNDPIITSEINDTIDDFIKYASTNKETHWIVTSSTTSENDDDEVEELELLLKLYEPGNSDFRKFEFPSRVGKPVAIKKTWCNVHLIWTSPSFQSCHPIEYIVSYRHKKEKIVDQKKWLMKTVPGGDNETDVDNLKPETTYEFKVTTKYSFGLGPESMISNPVITEAYPLVIRIQKDNSLSEILTSSKDNDGLPTYKLKVTVTYRDEISNIQKCDFGRSCDHSSLSSGRPTKVIMVMGATGAGKSTLINGMVNYILGVKFEDDFRFKLICDERQESQAHSQTDIVTAYTFYWQDGFQVPYNLTIIDTPGFGDTRGINRDKEIPRQVAQLFSLKGSKGIDEIHAIGFVTQSALIRLTATQRYIFSSILEIYGNNIKDNIFVMATFADNPKPKVINAIEEAKVPFAKSFPFNNSGLYEDRQNQTTSLFWKMGYNSFSDFFIHLQDVSPASLQLTCEVLREREQLQTTLTGMQKLIQAGLAKMDTLRKEEEILKQKQADIEANEKFEYEVTVKKQKKIDLEPGDGAAICANCTMTCQYPCKTPNHEMHECGAMDIGGESAAKCQVCPGKCSWRDHSNQPYRLDYYEEVEIKKSDELLGRYKVATAEKFDVEQIVSSLQDELGDLSEEVHGYVEKVKRCLARLNEIALRPNAHEEVDYLDVLIETEKQEKKDRYQDRINSYTQLREQARLLAKTSRSTENVAELQQKGSKKAWWKFWSYWN